MSRILLLGTMILSILSTSEGARHIKTFGAYSGCAGGVFQTIDKPTALTDRTTVAHWENGTSSVSFWLNIEGSGDYVSFQNTKSQVQAALGSWSDIPESFLDLSYGGDGSQYVVSASDNKNSIVWIEDGGDPLFIQLCLSMNALAVTFLTTNASSEITDADIAFNGVNWNWVINNTSTPGSDPDIQSIAAHELGHTLGIGHSHSFYPAEQPTMYSPYPINSHSNRGRSLEADDKLGPAYLYRKDISIPTDFSTLAAAVAYASTGSNQVITIDASAGTMVVASNLTIKSGLTIVFTGGADLQVNSGVTLTVNPNVAMKFDAGSSMVVNGKINATDATFSNVAGNGGVVWDGIYLNSGPNTMYGCRIELANHGIILMNNTSTTLISRSASANSSIDWCQTSGIYSSNSGVNSLTVEYTNLFQNYSGISLTSNAGAKLKYVDIRNSLLYGIHVYNSQLFMDHVTIRDGYGKGMYVDGASSSVRFSKNGVSPGYNELKNNAGGQVRRAAGTVLIGQRYSYCACWSEMSNTISGIATTCEEGCPWTDFDYAGYNYISGPDSWVSNEGSGTIAAHLTYWGNPYECPPNGSHFNGSVSNALSLGCEMESRLAFDAMKGMGGSAGDNVVWEEGQDSLGMKGAIAHLIRQLEDTPDSVEFGIPLLATLMESSDMVLSLLPTSWDDFLVKVAVSSSSPLQRRMATIFRIQNFMNSHRYREAIGFSRDILANQPDDELKFYCRSQIIGSYLGLGMYGSARNEHEVWKTEGLSINRTATESIGLLIALASRENPRLPETHEIPVPPEQTGNPATDAYVLLENYPNPFNPTTTIKYSLTAGAPVKIVVYDIEGREIARLVDEFQEPGDKEVEFKADNIPSGIYFYRFTAGNQSVSKKMVFLK